MGRSDKNCKVVARVRPPLEEGGELIDNITVTSTSAKMLLQ